LLLCCRYLRRASPTAQAREVVSVQNFAIALSGNFFTFSWPVKDLLRTEIKGATRKVISTVINKSWDAL
jgi:hypothetical protein